MRNKYIIVDDNLENLIKGVKYNVTLENEHCYYVGTTRIDKIKDKYTVCEIKN